MSGIELFAAAWTLGAVATYFGKVRKISVDSPAVGLFIAFVVWLFLCIPQGRDDYWDGHE